MISCNSQKKVVLIKQWHLAPDIDTSNIEQSKILPAYRNQIEIYSYLKKKIINKKINYYAEGCAGRTKQSYARSYNGWTLESLKAIAREKREKTLAPIGMKLLSMYGQKFNHICPENKEELIQHQKSFNELIRYHSLYSKFKESLNPKVEKLRLKILQLIAQFEYFIKVRNDRFIESIKRTSGDDNYVVIGGLHIKDLAQKLKKEGYIVDIVTPKNYVDEDDILLDKLKQSLKYEVIFFQVPEGFNLKQFPLNNSLWEKENYLDSELYYLFQILLKFKLSERLLFSDFDQDGIRDFSLSSKENRIVVTAEDEDWDNDGVFNLEDLTVGNKTISRKKALVEKLSSYIKIIYLDESKFTNEIVKYIKEYKSLFLHEKININYISFRKPKFTKGKKVFFSYIPSSKTIEVYPGALKNYLDQAKLNFYERKLIILHSLFHEVGHSLLDLDVDKLASANNWSIITDKINSFYLSHGRSRYMKRIKNYKSLKFKEKNYSSWLKEHKKYIRTVDKLLKSGKDFHKIVKATPWWTGKEYKNKSYLTSFLRAHKLISLYSLKNPKEWAAEAFSGCFLKNKLKKNLKLSSIFIEKVSGVNILALSDSFCEDQFFGIMSL
ncbi:MAG: hypothetical protein N4A33_06025 [Bacteriovoracaceae bacterium]|jgi:hypothetical protein|nr:hypothetical protein [Bacteriovoracaceae bacterium]